MHIAIDAVGIRGHGGAAVLCELLHWLPKVKPDWTWHVYIFNRNLREFDNPIVPDNVRIETTNLGNNGFERLKWIQEYLPEKLYLIGADVVFSFANIGNSNSFVPQVIFCHQPNAFFYDGIPRQAFLKRARLLFMRNKILQGAMASEAMIVQTHAMKNRIIQIKPALMDKIHVIPSGYRTLSGKPNIRNEKRNMIDKAQRPRLIYVSHPSEHKNHIALIRAMPQILKSFPLASLLLTLEKENPPNKRYASFIHNFYNHAKILGVENNIVWTGILNPDEVSYALSNCEMSVFPSLAESFGLGLVESLAAGCPVAGADLRYVHDICGNAAVYFNPNDPNDIANTIVTTCGNKAKIENIKLLCKQHSAKYSYRLIAHNIAFVLENAAKIKTEVGV